MKHYVLGFVFSYKKDKVLLVKKKRPEWQAGKYNGIGGKINDIDKSPLAAMQREGEEETGMRLNWEHCITFVCSGGTVFVYKAIDNLNCGHENFCNDIHFKQIEDEELKVWRIDSLPDNVDKEIHWVIPICLSDIQVPICVHLKDIEKYTKKSNG